MEAVFQVAVEQERRARRRIDLPRRLAHVVLDAVVVHRLRSIGIERANLELIEPPPPQRGEEEQLVAPDRPADRRAPVVGNVDGIARRARPIARAQSQTPPQIIVDVLALQPVVHEIQVVIARDAVRARARHHVHVDAAGIAFRGPRRRLHVVFLAHLEAVVLHRLSAVRARPVGLEAVDAERLLAVGGSEHFEVVLLHALGAADVEAAGDDAGDESGHHPGIASGGNRVEQLLVDVRLRGRRRDVDDGQFTTDRDRLGDTADGEIDVDARDGGHLHAHLFAAQRGEA